MHFLQDVFQKKLNTFCFLYVRGKCEGNYALANAKEIKWQKAY